MVTFCLILVALATAVLIAMGGIVVLGTIFGGVILIVLDVIVGIAPFVLLFVLIRWLLQKRG